jgi:CheY-like chemotaxis protein
MKSETANLAGQSSRARWMVVDDNDGILSLMRAVLAQLCDAPIEYFHDAPSALAAFRAAPDRFQFVITDLEMPGMNGIELCHELHALAPALKIVLSTGSRAITPAEAKRDGFCALLDKPFPFAALRSTLEAVGMIAPEAKRTLKEPARFAAALAALL